MDLVLTGSVTPDRLFGCRGEAPQRLRKGTSPMETTRRLAPPPVSQEIPIFLPAGRSRRSQNSVKSVSNRPNAGIGGRNYLLNGEVTEF